METYPDVFPKPTVANYSIGVDMGLLRTTFDTGRARQRRSYKIMPHTFGLTFVVALRDLWDWQNWVNAYAYDWFILDMASFLTGYTTSAGYCSQHAVRLISDLAMTAVNQQYFRITVTAEMVDPLNNIIISQQGDWIIGGEPAAPSADFLIAGDPNSPATESTNPGSPQFPTVEV